MSVPAFDPSTYEGQDRLQHIEKHLGNHATALNSGSLMAMHLDVFGHSYAEGQAVKADRWSSKFARRLGVGYWGERNRGVTGATIANNSTPASWATLLQDLNSAGSMPVIPVGPTWNLPNFQVVCIAHGINDLNTLDGRTVIGNLDPIKQALRTVVSRYRSGAIRENNDATVALVGTWATASTTDPPRNSSSSYAYTTANNSTVTITLPSDFPAGATVAIGFTAEASQGGTWTFTKNGSAVGSVVAVNPNAGFGHMPYLFRVGNCQPGDVIVGTVSALAVESIFDYWQVEAGTESTPASVPPLVLILKQPKLPDYSAYPSGLVTDASVANLNTIFDQVASEFGSSVIAVDLSAMDSNAAYFGTDKLHPNDLGHSLIATKLYTTLATNRDKLPNAYADVNPAPYFGLHNGHAGIDAPTCRGWYHGNLVLAAGTTYFARATVERPMNLTNVILQIQVAATLNDGVEIAIYRVYRNGHLVRAFTTGVVASKLNSGTGRVVFSMAANATLQPGYVYYVAVQCPVVNGVAATIARAEFTDAKYVTAYGTAFPDVEAATIAGLSSPLPTTITTAPTATGNTAKVVLSEV